MELGSTNLKSFYFLASSGECTIIALFYRLELSGELILSSRGC